MVSARCGAPVDVDGAPVPCGELLPCALHPWQVEAAIAALELRPGDVLVVSVGIGARLDQLERMRALLIERLPMLADVIVITAEQLAVVRADE